MSRGGAAASRVVEIVVPLAGLAAILVFLVAILTPVGGAVRCAFDDTCEDVEPSVGAVMEAVVSGGAPPRPGEGSVVGAGTVAVAEEPWMPATALPIQVAVESGSDLRRWSHAAGRDRVIEAPPLDPWQRVMLGRFLAIDEFAVHYADRFGTDPLWLLQVMSAESALDPTAKGPEDGDRGLGQVSFTSEETASSWAQDPRSPYYTPDFDASRSIWSPRENIILASIVLRSIYAMPDVVSHEQAYARYTHGLRAVDEDGHIALRSMVRVERAQDYADLLRLFLALGYSDLEDIRSNVAEPALLDDPLVAKMLVLNRETEDGLPMYLALRDLYLDEALPDEPSDWGYMLNMREALLYTRLARMVDSDEHDERSGDEHLERIRQAIEARMPQITTTGDRDLIGVAERTLADIAHDLDQSPQATAEE